MLWEELLSGTAGKRSEETLPGPAAAGINHPTPTRRRNPREDLEVPAPHLPVPQESILKQPVLVLSIREPVVQPRSSFS